MSTSNRQEPPPQLLAAVRESLANIDWSVRSYLVEGKHSLYRTVAVELRKLLLDKDSVRSFLGRGEKRHNLFEAAFGKGDRIYLQSFLSGPGSATDGYFDVGPPLYPSPASVLIHARNDDKLVPLREWLEECTVHDSTGAIRKTANILRDIANKEGAHIINREKKDYRNEAGITLLPVGVEPTIEELTAANWEANWQQFVIGAGAKLLYARRWDRGEWQRLFASSLDALRAENADNADAFTLQMRRNV